MPYKYRQTYTNKTNVPTILPCCHSSYKASNPRSFILNITFRLSYSIRIHEKRL